MPRRDPFRFIEVKTLVAARRVSTALHRAGVPHAFAGGLAVVVGGWERLVPDLEVIVPLQSSRAAREVLDATGPLPVRVELDATGLGDRTLDRAIRGARRVSGLPILAAAPLVILKLRRNLARDRADVVELLKHGDLNDAAAIRAYLETNALAYVQDFDALVVTAAGEPP